MDALTPADEQTLPTTLAGQIKVITTRPTIPTALAQELDSSEAELAAANRAVAEALALQSAARHKKFAAENAVAGARNDASREQIANAGLLVKVASVATATKAGGAVVETLEQGMLGFAMGLVAPTVLASDASRSATQYVRDLFGSDFVTNKAGFAKTGKQLLSETASLLARQVGAKGIAKKNLETKLGAAVDVATKKLQAKLEPVLADDGTPKDIGDMIVEQGLKTYLVGAIQAQLKRTIAQQLPAETQRVKNGAQSEMTATAVQILADLGVTAEGTTQRAREAARHTSAITTAVVTRTLFHALGAAATVVTTPLMAATNALNGAYDAITNDTFNSTVRKQLARGRSNPSLTPGGRAPN